jgi:hypothetical protein
VLVAGPDEQANAERETATMLASWARCVFAITEIRAARVDDCARVF